jgi:hypothetical protein
LKLLLVISNPAPLSSFLTLRAGISETDIELFVNEQAEKEKGRNDKPAAVPTEIRINTPPNADEKTH